MTCSASPKSCASPVDAIVTYSIVFREDGPSLPPINIARVAFAPHDFALNASDKSPKFCVLPCDANVINEIVFVLVGDLPPTYNPLVLFPQAPPFL